MLTLKKQIGPLVFIFIILTMNASLWFYETSSAYLTYDVILTSISGSSLLMFFMIVFLLSTRQPLLVKIFGGLENVYAWHRLLAIFTVLSIFAHGFFATASGLINIPDVFFLGRANEAGIFARNLFLFLVAFALLAKYMKYEHFRYIHRLLIIPYIIALYHGFFSTVLDLFTFNLLSIWMLLTSAIGLGASLYMILVYQRTAFTYKGTIIDKTMLTNQIVEIKVKLHKPYHFKAGQFAFIKLYAKGFSKDPHPFSVSGSDEDHIYFTIKALGDFTKALSQDLKTPAKIKLTKPYGSMTYDAKDKQQVWVAGGIGITPFLGYLRTRSTIDHPIHMIYSVKEASEAVHLQTLRTLAKKQKYFSFTLHDTSKQGFITANELNLNHDSIVYMCGPRSMVLSLRKQIRDYDPQIPMVYEAFSFTGTLLEDILRLIKKTFRKYNKS